MRASTANKYTLIAIGLAVFGTVAVVASLVAYGAKLHSLGLSPESSHWGTFGDFIGGFAGTVVSLATLVALAYTLHLQAEELKKTSDALTDQSEALKYQAKVNGEQLRLAREVEFRRIRPLLTLDWEEDTKDYRLSLFVKNVGLGPAIIDQITVLELNDGTEEITRDSRDLKEIWERVIEESMPGGKIGFPDSDWKYTVKPVADLFRGLAANDQHRLFSLRFDDRGAMRTVLPSLRENLRLIIHFRSVAGQALTTENQYDISLLSSDKA